jgi:hypothetical protein
VRSRETSHILDILREDGDSGQHSAIVRIALAPIHRTGLFDSALRIDCHHGIDSAVQPVNAVERLDDELLAGDRPITEGSGQIK